MQLVQFAFPKHFLIVKQPFLLTVLLAVDSPFSSTIVLLNTKRFPCVSGGFLEGPLGSEWLEGTHLKIYGRVLSSHPVLRFVKKVKKAPKWGLNPCFNKYSAKFCVLLLGLMDFPWLATTYGVAT